MIQLQEHEGTDGRIHPGGPGPTVTEYLTFVSQGWAAKLGGPARELWSR